MTWNEKTSIFCHVINVFFFNNRILAPPLGQSSVMITFTTLTIEESIIDTMTPLQFHDHEVILVLFSPGMSPSTRSCTLQLDGLTRCITIRINRLSV